MKNLANCTPKEFLKQTYRIKNAVEKWLKDIDLSRIRANVPKLTPVTGLEGEELEKVKAENRKIMSKQIMENGMKILDNVMDKYADETVEVLALCCFVEPSEAESHTMSEYLESIGDLLSDKGVLSFFTSLAQLQLPNTQVVSNR